MNVMLRYRRSVRDFASIALLMEAPMKMLDRECIAYRTVRSCFDSLLPQAVMTILASFRVSIDCSQ